MKNKIIPHTSKINLAEVWEINGRNILFRDGTGCLPDNFESWTEVQLKHVRYHLIEFVASYRVRSIGRSIMLTTMKVYIMVYNLRFQTAGIKNS